MKAYVNVLILFWFYYTNVLTRKEYWSHEWKIYPVVIKVLEMTFQYTCDKMRTLKSGIAG
jgi:hypothetical protein